MNSKTICTSLAVALGIVSGAVATASADQSQGYDASNWPLGLVDRPLVPAKGMLEVRGDTLRVNLSKGSAFEPISVAPDIYYGIKESWTVGLTHQTGICLTGSSGGCAKTYNDLGLELGFSLMGRGSFQLTAVGGTVVSSFADPFTAGLSFGFLSKIKAGKVAVFARPRLYVGLSNRDLQGDVVEIPVDLSYQLQPQTALSLETGVIGTLDNLSDNNQIPVGFAALFAINEKIDIGAAMRFTNLAGSDGGIDGRELLGRFALRL